MAERGGGCGQKGLILDDAKHLKIHLDPPPHPSGLPCQSCPGPAPCLGPQLGVDAGWFFFLLDFYLGVLLC